MTFDTEKLEWFGYPMKKELYLVPIFSYWIISWPWNLG